jgi:hypothetical protein
MKSSSCDQAKAKKEKEERMRDERDPTRREQKRER